MYVEDVNILESVAQKTSVEKIAPENPMPLSKRKKSTMRSV